MAIFYVRCKYYFLNIFSFLSYALQKYCFSFRRLALLLFILQVEVFIAVREIVVQFL